MSKIVVQMSLSLDGFMEGPDHDISWHMVDEEVHTDVNAYLETTGAFLQGRVTHELMVDYWPTADEDPSAPAPVRDFARIWRDKPKYVFSKTYDRTDWNTTILRDVVPEEIEKLKAQTDRDIAIGGADLAQTFMALDLIDDYRLYIDPIVIGAGTRLFPPDVRFDLQLVETRSFGNGVVLVRYGRRLPAGGLAEGGVEGLDRGCEVIGARRRRRVVGEGVAGLAIHSVDGLHALPQRGLLLAEAHEVEADRAVVEGIRRGAAHHLAALGLAGVGRLALAELDVAEVGGGDLLVEPGRVLLGAAEQVLLVLE